MHDDGAPTPLTSRKSGPLSGSVEGPGDKSVSHRSLILGALSVGETRIEGLLEGDDVLRTAAAMRAFGAEVERLGPGSWRVRGVGVGGLMEPREVLDCGNSGTGVRLIMGMAATQDIAVTYTGDASLCRRPMGRILDPLALFGAQSMGRAGGKLPLVIKGSADAAPIRYETPMASAQVKSAVLLAALNVAGETTVIEKAPTRDHTERMLRGFGATVEVAEIPGRGGVAGRQIRLIGQPELVAQSIAAPRDPSSAAFPMAAALLVEGSSLTAPTIGVNPTRAGFYQTVQDMGGDLSLDNPREEGGEPVADIRAAFSALKGIEVPPDRAPSMIDEYPILSVLAAFAEGTTVMRGVAELRVKETDRIAAMAKGLRACGVEVEEETDAMIVHGRGADGVRGGATVSAELDHRIAMSFAVLGLAAKEPVVIDDARPIATSFPSFVDLMRGVGASLDL